MEKQRKGGARQLRRVTRPTWSAVRFAGRFGLRVFDFFFGGPGRVTEMDVHNAYNPYSASYDPDSRRLDSGRKR